MIAGCSLGLWTHLNQNGVTNIPKPPIVQNTLRQPHVAVIQLINGTNNTSEKYCDALKIADAVPRSAVGNHAATNRPLPGNVGANANPARKKRMNSVTMATLIVNEIGPK